MHVPVIGAGIVGAASAHAILDAGHRGHRSSTPATNRAAPATAMPAGSRISTSCRSPRRRCGGMFPAGLPIRWVRSRSVRPIVPRIAPWLIRFIAASRPGADRALHRGDPRPERTRRCRHGGGGSPRSASPGTCTNAGSSAVWATRGGFEGAASTIARQRGYGIPVEILDRDAPRFARTSPGAARDRWRALPDRLPCRRSEGARRRACGIRPGNAAHALCVAGPLPSWRAARQSRSGCRVASRSAADAVVVAAGAWSKPLAASLGDRVPLDTERGYNATFPSGTLGLSRPVAFEGEGFVTTPLDCGDRVGGAVEFGGLEAAPDYRRIDAIVDAAAPFPAGSSRRSRSRHALDGVSSLAPGFSAR